ncbi:MAG: hypothetical protein K5683_08535 [Prevotella sp.]|nr:hypothetical protein [Prevotella sp.]
MSKKLWAAILLGCLSAPVSAGEVSDTLVIEDVNKVKIETRDTVQRIVMNGRKGEPDFQYVQRISIPDSSAVRRTMMNVRDFNKIVFRKKNGSDSEWEGRGHFNLGLNTMVGTPDGYDFKLWPSFALGLGWTAYWHPYGKHNEWGIGWALEWRSFASDKKSYWTKTGDMMALTPYPAGQKSSSTKLKVFALQLPLTFTHYFDQDCDWGLTVGAIVNWNFHTYASYGYETGNEDHSISLKKIGTRPFTVDAIVKVKTPWLPSLYCKYSPMKFFKDNRGPEMNQLSFGVFF